MPMNGISPRGGCDSCTISLTPPYLASILTLSCPRVISLNYPSAGDVLLFVRHFPRAFLTFFSK